MLNKILDKLNSNKKSKEDNSKEIEKIINLLNKIKEEVNKDQDAYLSNLKGIILNKINIVIDFCENEIIEKIKLNEYILKFNKILKEFQENKTNKKNLTNLSNELIEFKDLFSKSI